MVSQAQCEADSVSLHLFHQWERLKCNGHMPSVGLVCEVVQNYMVANSNFQESKMSLSY